MAGLIVVVVLGVAWSLRRAVCLVPAVTARNVERFGRYHRTLRPGLALVVPFVDRVRAPIDLREQVLTRGEEPIITRDHWVVRVDLTVRFMVLDPRAAAYEVDDYRYELERLVVTTLRTLGGAVDRERAVAARADLSWRLRSALLGAGRGWGVIVSKVEVTAVEAATGDASARDRSSG